MMDDSQTRTVLVTGGARGIGAAIAKRLSAGGWSVISASRSVPAAADRIQGVRYVSLDVADESRVARFFGELEQRGTALQGLVNNAARQGGESIADQTCAEWQSYFDINVTGPWLTIKYALSLLSDGASVVNVGSAASVAGFPNRAAYTASKHALLGLTRAAASELAPRNIRVNHLTLGSFETPGLSDLAARNGGEIGDYANRQLLNRVGAPAEAAAACLFLLSGDASFITGTSMTVDGGLLTKGAFG